jgi:murein L,D-transpeptidase YcbB/YkuD
LFDKTERALSHGCIRVQNPERLVALFLKNDQNTSELPEVLSAMEKYDRKRVYLKYPFPIMVVYLTAEVKNGLLNFYKDLYQKDNDLAKALKIEF